MPDKGIQLLQKESDYQKMLQLTSYNRMLRYLASAAGTALTDTKAQKQLIVNWITTASKQIETFLGRTMSIAAYTEYFDLQQPMDTIFFVKAPPIITLTDVYIDSEGSFDGGESEITDCIIGRNSDSVILPYNTGIVARKAVRVRYTGGMAYSGVQSLFAVTGVTGTWAVSKYAAGVTSEAVGIVKATTASTLTLETLYGIFESGESVAQYAAEDLSGSSDAAATINSITRQSLVETYPDIVRATEIQVRHYWKHKDDFEAISTQRDGTNQRIPAGFDQFTKPLTNEAMALLSPYRRLTV